MRPKKKGDPKAAHIIACRERFPMPIENTTAEPERQAPSPWAAATAARLAKRLARARQRVVVQDDGTALVTVSGSDKPAVIDAADVELVGRHSWRLNRDGYARTTPDALRAAADRDRLARELRGEFDRSSIAEFQAECRRSAERRAAIQKRVGYPGSFDELTEQVRIERMLGWPSLPPRPDRPFFPVTNIDPRLSDPPWVTRVWPPKEAEVRAQMYPQGGVETPPGDDAALTDILTPDDARAPTRLPDAPRGIPA